ncbi:MAG: septum formation protein Maf [Chthoniobacterales bacterium]|nr:MAG: septum formation protein Maf [Chthoniobacterales bacterium]
MAARFILASGSPRRRQLLEEAGYEFEINQPAVAEVSAESFTIREITICNATRKALAVARNFPDAVVLGADTLVALGGEVIGKPADLARAQEILRRLSGRSHEVRTAVFICHLARGQVHSFQEVSRVHFRALGHDAILKYLAKVDPLDKAGAYAAQGHGTEIIERIEGSYSNVVGLPMESTARVLRGFGIKSRLG